MLRMTHCSPLTLSSEGTALTDTDDMDDLNNESSSDSSDKSSESKSVLILGASGGCDLAAVHLCAGIGVSRIVAP